jgi:hypothetical protein
MGLGCSFQSLIRGLILFVKGRIRDLSTPQSSLLITITLGVRFQHRNFGETNQSLFPSARPLANINLLSVSIELPTKWNHPMCGVLWWDLSLRMFSRFVRVIACISTSLLSVLNGAWTHHIVREVSSVDEHGVISTVSDYKWCCYEHSCKMFVWI